jgi:hypothetical protein
VAWDGYSARGRPAIRAVQAGGNYAEIYERNVGVQSRLGIPRGLNQLLEHGRHPYAPPIRNGKEIVMLIAADPQPLMRLPPNR